jgi:glycosyltransferase involved in cell wall biosynthesis
MTSPTVSVVMAVRNGASKLDRAIASIRAQTVQPHEIVLIDGRSSDETVAIARRAGVRVERQLGATLADAYNEGVAGTSGDHVAFLAYDDEWTPRKLELQLAALDTQAERGIAIGLAQFVCDPGDELPAGVRSVLLDAPRPARIMETLLAPRAVLEHVGPLRAEASPSDDVDWYARAGDLRVPVAIVDEVILIKRLHANSNAHTSAGTAPGILRALHDSIKRKQAASGA